MIVMEPLFLPLEVEDKALEPYLFYLAFENSFCDDYMSEKFFKAYEVGVYCYFTLLNIILNPKVCKLGECPHTPYV